MNYSRECLEYFITHQSQLFDEPVAEDLEEAAEFLEDCMAVVVSSFDEVKKYLEESGMDISGLSNEELKDEAEIFAIPNGTYLIVEG